MPPARILLFLLSFGGVALLVRTLAFDPLPEWIPATGLGIYLVVAMVGFMVPQLEMYGDVFSRGNPTVSKVALTFEGGPDPKYTPRVLEMLREHGDIKATFFVRGARVAEHLDLLTAIDEAGHGVGLGGYEEDQLYAWKAPSYVKSDIQRTQAVIEKATGKRATLMRPPGGGRVGARTATAAKKAGLTLVAWSASGVGKQNADELLAQIEKRLGPGVVIRLQEGGDDTQLPVTQLLPKLLAQLDDRGLQVVGLETLIES